MEGFYYTHFSAMPIAVIRPFFTDYDDEYICKVYDSWLDDFGSKSSVFYISQLTNHRQYVEKMFYREYELDTDYDIGYYCAEVNGMAELWDDYCDAQGLSHHESIMDDLRTMANLRRPRAIVSTKEVFEEWAFWLESDKPNPAFFEEFIDALWFNQTISNTPERAKELRSMTYPEYLKTRHWRRVRSAMLMLHRARCQTLRCSGMDGAWMGDEKYMHVHHVSYKHRGNERYNDLRLLCDDCHKRHHAGEKIEYEDGVVTMYEYIQNRLDGNKAS